MITIERFLNSWNNNVDAETKTKLIEEYGLDIWVSKDKEIYIIESNTNSGIQINRDKTFLFLLSGVYEFQYYDTMPNLITKTSDFKEECDKLFLKEKINKDRLVNVMIFIEDISTFDSKSGLEVMN